MSRRPETPEQRAAYWGAVTWWRAIPAALRFVVVVACAYYALVGPQPWAQLAICLAAIDAWLARLSSEIEAWRILDERERGAER